MIDTPPRTLQDAYGANRIALTADVDAASSSAASRISGATADVFLTRTA